MSSKVVRHFVVLREYDFNYVACNWGEHPSEWELENMSGIYTTDPDKMTCRHKACVLAAEKAKENSNGH